MAEERIARMEQVELEVPIAVPRSRVWQALTEETDAWWLADFRALGEDSTVRFDARVGGVLSESGDGGSGLVWYSVQMVEPGSTLYLVGHTAPDWGGPVLSMLKLSLRDVDEGAVLRVVDALMGKVGEEQAASVESGWARLFGDGLKAYVEGKPRAAE